MIPNEYPNQYFLGGKGVPGTDTFSLASYRGAATLKVKPGSPALRGGGYVLSALGLTGSIVGGTFGLLKLMGSDSMSGKLVVGMTGAGVAALAAGIAMLVAGGTDYQVEQGAAAAVRSGSDTSL
ncbi:MAG: hypothetical protein HY903_04690 [Deltaproteobacteria bacterium]|nr:hypothetical protein [Deltaproteobacteria bacterium]